MDSKKENKNRLFQIRWFYIAFVILIAGSFLVFDFSHIDDTVYNETVDAAFMEASDLEDSGSPYDSIENGSLVIAPGEGLKMFTGEISLKEGDALRISFGALNSSGKEAKLTVDLYGEDFDDPYDEFTIKLPKGESTVSKEIAFYRNEHPETCSIRIFTSDNKDLVISDLQIDRLTATKDNSRLSRNAVRCMQILTLGALIYLIIYVLHKVRSKEFPDRERTESAERLRNFVLYVSTALFVTVVLVLLYRKADLSLPLIYSGGDEMGVYYFAKMIDQNGLSLVNPMTGGTSGADMFDYMYSDKLSFLFVKMIGIFTDNPYLIINLFYFLNYYIIAETAVWVSVKLGVSRINSFVAGALFAFSPYIQLRYSHIWLTPYYMIPLVCLLAIYIIQGRFPSEADREKRSRIFWSGMIMAFLCAYTGMYYAYFACAVFAAAMVIRMISTGGKELRKEIYPLAYIASTVIGVVVNIMPNLLYRALNGSNPYSELTIRERGDSETYALKLVQMILPRTGHRIGLFSRIARGYINHYPLVNENMTAAIGIIASAGLLISLLLLFSRSNRYKEISWLNLAVFIIATVGGVGSIISVAVVLPMRSYNRMSLIIMFLSLLLIAMLLDRLKAHTKPVLAIAASLCILVVGIYDQTVDYEPYDTRDYKSTAELLQSAANVLEEGDMVFELPYLDWPSSTTEYSYGQFIGYLETDGLHWSYGAMQGREEARWQSCVAECGTDDMIDKLMYAGYDGIYLDRSLYEDKYGEEKTEADIAEITQVTGYEPLVSEDSDKYFWMLDSNR